MGTDLVVGIALGVGGHRDQAFCEDGPEVHGDHVVAGEEEVKIERRLRPVGPEGHVGEGRFGGGVIDAKDRRRAAFIFEVDLEIRKQQRRRGHVVNGAHFSVGRGYESRGCEARDKAEALERLKHLKHGVFR
ncbi:MAG: hypothetical protein AAFY88_20480 [Acidobacteriota bacterium]